MQNDQAMVALIRRLQEDIEIARQAVLKNASPSEQADTFRNDRVRDVVAGAAPVAMGEGAKTFLHIVPLATHPVSLAIGEQQVQEQARKIFPLNGSGFFSRLNFDGHLNFDSSRRVQGTASSYIQLFRNGAIEFCDVSLLEPTQRNGGAVKVIWAEHFEGRIIASLTASLKLLEQLSVPLPVMVFLSLAGVNEYVISDGKPFFDDLYPIDRDTLLPPGQLIEHWEEKPDHILKPIFDVICNAAGLQKSKFYDANGDWKGRQG
jgi:hypothetical protein